jgi:tRNA U34 2-thiouridine synthase MnmA/TrmU
MSDDGLTAVLKEPDSGIAPGQTAVIYEEDRVIVAGTIERTERQRGGKCAP